MRSAGEPSSSEPASSSSGDRADGIRALRVMAEQFAAEKQWQQAILCLEAIMPEADLGHMLPLDEVEVRDALLSDPSDALRTPWPSSHYPLLPVGTAQCSVRLAKLLLAHSHNMFQAARRLETVVRALHLRGNVLLFEAAQCERPESTAVSRPPVFPFFEPQSSDANRFQLPPRCAAYQNHSRVC